MESCINVLERHCENTCVWGKVRGWQVARPHCGRFGSAARPHWASGTGLALEGTQQRCCTLGTGGLLSPEVCLTLTALSSSLTHTHTHSCWRCACNLFYECQLNRSHVTTLASSFVCQKLEVTLQISIRKNVFLTVTEFSWWHDLNTKSSFNIWVKCLCRFIHWHHCAAQGALSSAPSPSPWPAYSRGQHNGPPRASSAPLRPPPGAEWPGASQAEALLPWKAGQEPQHRCGVRWPQTQQWSRTEPQDHDGGERPGWGLFHWTHLFS